MKKPIPPSVDAPTTEKRVAPKTERIREIQQRMAQGRWTRERLERQILAEKWGITIETLKNDACEASRGLTLDDEERKNLRLENFYWLASLAEEARATTNTITGMPDFRAAIDARKLASEYAGVRADDPLAEGDGAKPRRIDIKILPPEKKP